MGAKPGLARPVRLRFPVILFCFLPIFMTALAQVNWQVVLPDYDWSFPEDHWAHHNYRIEWWYFTGQLAEGSEKTPRFGYQFTVYRVGLDREVPELKSKWATRNLIMAHAAVTDLENGAHLFSELLYRTTPFLGGFGEAGDPLIAWSRAPAGTDGRWELRWNGSGFDFSVVDRVQEFGFELSTTPVKPRIFQGPNGLSRKGEAENAASHYYSFTRLSTQGRLEIGGETHQVAGLSWMDKEFSSSFLTENQVGWDWFSLQLDDGRELMLFQLRDKSGKADFGRGTLVAADGSPTYLRLSEWKIEEKRRWRSPDGKRDYPVQWAIVIPRFDIQLEVSTRVDGQENRSELVPRLAYWEGAVEVFSPDARFLGRGFVEMTGYGGNRPPI